MTYKFKMKVSSDEDNYLMHYRTKGSKNGIRRYQYPDGSLTPEGRIHYGVGPARTSKSGKRKNKNNNNNNANGLAKEINDMAKGNADERQRISNAASEIATALAAAKWGKQVSQQVHSMTDEELKAATNRAKMEWEYYDAVQKASNIYSGKTQVETYLRVGKALVVGGTSITSLAKKINQYVEEH